MLLQIDNATSWIERCKKALAFIQHCIVKRDVAHKEWFEQASKEYLEARSKKWIFKGPKTLEEYNNRPPQSMTSLYIHEMYRDAFRNLVKSSYYCSYQYLLDEKLIIKDMLKGFTIPNFSLLLLTENELEALTSVEARYDNPYYPELN